MTPQSLKEPPEGLLPSRGNEFPALSVTSSDLNRSAHAKTPDVWSPAVLVRGWVCFHYPQKVSSM